MTGTLPRRPVAFPVHPERDGQTKQAERKPKPRKPVAMPPRQAEIIIAPSDPFDSADIAALEPEPLAPERRRGLSLSGIALSALGILLSAAFALWLDGIVRALFARHLWLGWAALCVIAIGTLALLAMAVREWLALRRLAGVESLRRQAETARSANEPRLAREAVALLASRLAGNPATARGRATLRETEGEVIDGADLLSLAETELLAPLDQQARTLILSASKRVSIVTAVSPRALIDVGYVLLESARLVRRLAEIYGSRPGTLGFIRLARNVVTHLAVTGSIAVGDSLIQQMVGHGIAARLSARLGEGVINGLMTVRVGIAAMDLVRPLPFHALKRPGVGDFMADLVRLQLTEKPDKPAERDR